MRVARKLEPIRCQLGYRPPLDWEALHNFLRMRAVPGVEHVEDGAYQRTVRSGNRVGWIRVLAGRAQGALTLEISPSLGHAQSTVVAGVRRMFDLDADPARIAARLCEDPRMAMFVARRPGLRVPRSFDAPELAARAILGQQVTVAAARTLAGRLARALGDPIETPFAGLDRLWPTPQQIARSSHASLVAIPLTRARAGALAHLMTAIAERKIFLRAAEADTPAADIEQTLSKLVELPGIGPWTAHYIAMRGLAWSDAFPDGDLVLRKALGGATVRACRAESERWRPFRSYAVLHLWLNHGSSAAFATAVAK
jgi:AraC family transcriptional regulator of adaptative response / DNA-3-methyladenine glycosylase II